MRDLRDQIDGVWRAASRLTSASGGRCVMFISSREGEGTSSIAASFALLAARKSQKSTWLLDLDLRRNAAFSSFEEGFARGVGKPGRAYDASLRTEPIYSVSQPGAAGEAAKPSPKLLSVHEIEKTRLLVSRFRTELLRKGQQVQLRSRPGWWEKVRQAADWIVVDAPALTRSPAGLAFAAQADGVFIIVEADSTGAEEVASLRDEIISHGGKVAGLVLNRMGSDARFADRLAG
ncbi:MAG: hypothetical protein RIB03_01645 [Henriciella sp.]|uniref:hypothetical protein n=1 Tax=Henriciella sp. TaxID=1968823 RepID=UPI0032EB2CDB